MHTGLNTTTAAELLVPKRGSAAALVPTLVRFLDVATTSTGRATTYNSREDQQFSEMMVHRAMLQADRDLYAVLLLLPGMTDHARQVGVRLLLSREASGTRLSYEIAQEVLYSIVRQLPPQRMIKLFESFRYGSESDGLHRINTAAARKLVLRMILGSKALVFWAVKYRFKLRSVLTHALGLRNSSILLSIISKPVDEWDRGERVFVRSQLLRHCPQKKELQVFAAYRFIFGKREESEPLFRDFYAAQTDLSAGSRLPLEVLEGIRSQYHPKVSQAELLSLAKGRMSKGQKLAVQKRAKKEGVEVDVDFSAYSPLRLYLYAYGCGLTEEIRTHLDEKARKAAASVCVALDSVGVLIDASGSMRGHATQKFRPIATALSVRDMLKYCGQSYLEEIAGGVIAEGGLIMPSGDTSLGTGFLRLVDLGVKAIFVISDGYENAPEGQFCEVLDAVRRLNIPQPAVYHVNPVFAAEGASVRRLSDEACLIPVGEPESFGVGVLRGLLEKDPEAALQGMTKMALSRIGSGG